MLAKQSALSLVLMALCLCTSLAQESVDTATAHWITQNSGVLNRLHGMFFADRKQGWIVGSNGLLLTTNDGGTQWTRQAAISREILRDVYFLDPQRGFVLGEYSVFNRPSTDIPKSRAFMLASADSGKTWDDLALVDEALKLDDPRRYSGLGILRMIFVDDRVGWACGEALHGGCG